jgi:hypothetical protein
VLLVILANNRRVMGGLPRVRLTPCL